MHCDQFELRLNEVLDERANPELDPSLTAHAADCDDCRVRLVGSRVLLRGLARLAVPPLPADFSRGVVAQVAEPQPEWRPKSRLWLAAGVLLASAAAALLAISLVWYARRGGHDLARGSDRPAPELRTGVPRRNRNFATVLPGKSVLPGKNRRPTEDFAATGGEWLIEAPRLPTRLRGYRGAIDNLALALPQTAEQLNQVEHYAPGFRPLRVSLELVWETFCRAIPGARPDEPQHPQRTGQWPSAGLFVV
jgi:hypothetical protein